MKGRGLTAVAACIATLVGSASAGAAPTGESSARALPPQTYTPVIMRALAPPRWYKGIDNRIHVEYEVQLVNGFPVDATVTELVVRRGAGGTLADLTGGALLATISPVGAPTAHETTIPANSAATAFVDFTVANRAQVPKRIEQAISVTIDPGSLPVPADSVSVGGATRVHQGPPVRIDAPLAGARWAAIVGVHRTALQPVDGRFLNGQRFAIDWNRLDDQFRPEFGDRSTFASNPSYGAPVMAVGDGKVVTAIDGIPNQAPGTYNPVGSAEADGNVVILKLQKDTYAGYAHLIPGSVTVTAGDRVESGEVLGKLGNSGNSNGPHLHFQLMNAPSLLASESVPFVLRRFDLVGIVPSLDVYGEADQGQTPVPFSTVGAGPYRNRRPVGLDILDLPG